MAKSEICLNLPMSSQMLTILIEDNEDNVVAGINDYIARLELASMKLRKLRNQVLKHNLDQIDIYDKDGHVGLVAPQAMIDSLRQNEVLVDSGHNHETDEWSDRDCRGEYDED